MFRRALEERGNSTTIAVIIIALLAAGGLYFVFTGGDTDDYDAPETAENMEAEDAMEAPVANPEAPKQMESGEMMEEEAGDTMEQTEETGEAMEETPSTESTDTTEESTGTTDPSADASAEIDAMFDNSAEDDAAKTDTESLGDDPTVGDVTL
jgi:hypothetical protein